MKIITGKDGKMETVNELPSEKVTKADVDRTRRELRDMIEGNTQFHRDEFKDAQFGDLPPIEPGLCLDSGEFVPARQINLWPWT